MSKGSAYTDAEKTTLLLGIIRAIKPTNIPWDTVELPANRDKRSAQYILGRMLKAGETGGENACVPAAGAGGKRKRDGESAGVAKGKGGGKGKGKGAGKKAKGKGGMLREESAQVEEADEEDELAGGVVKKEEMEEEGGEGVGEIGEGVV